MNFQNFQGNENPFNEFQSSQPNENHKKNFLFPQNQNSSFSLQFNKHMKNQNQIQNSRPKENWSGIQLKTNQKENSLDILNIPDLGFGDKHVNDFEKKKTQSIVVSQTNKNLLYDKNTLTILRVKRKREENPISQIFVHEEKNNKKRRRVMKTKEEKYDEKRGFEDKLVSCFKIEKNEAKLNQIVPLIQKLTKQEKFNIRKTTNLRNIMEEKDERKWRKTEKERQKHRNRRIIRISESRDDSLNGKKLRVIDFETRGASTKDLLQPKNGDWMNDYLYNYYLFSGSELVSLDFFKDRDVECFNTHGEIEYDDDVNNGTEADLDDDENAEGYYKNDYPEEENYSSGEEEKGSDEETNDDEDDMNNMIDEDEDEDLQFQSFIEVLEKENQLLREKNGDVMEDD